MEKIREIQITDPLSLFRFVDEYYSDMDDESRLELLSEVYGVDLLPVSDENMNLPEFKFLAARVLKSNFKKETGDPRPIVLLITLDTPPQWLIDPLSRPTTPEQMEYLTWLVNAKNLPSDSSDMDGIPDYVKAYLRECGVEV